MPMRTYLCMSCGMMFDKLVRGDTPETPCKRCSEPAIRHMASRAAVSSAHMPTAPTPQNTGASLLDHEVDMVIARDARKNLREMEARQDMKMRLMAREKVSGTRLSRLDTGEYFVMSPEQRAAAKRARLLHQEVVKGSPPE